MLGSGGGVPPGAVPPFGSTTTRARNSAAPERYGRQSTARPQQRQKCRTRAGARWPGPERYELPRHRRPRWQASCYFGSIADMKVSVSIPDEDVEFLDNYTKTHQIESRSAALHRAIRLLRASELGDAYAAAFTEWADDSANDAWDNAVVDS